MLRHLVTLLTPWHLQSNLLILFHLLLPPQTLMYTAITYPMLQLEWTAAKVFWYLLMQVNAVDLVICLLLSTFPQSANCWIIAPLLVL